jgi:hypothetical protein
VVVDTAVAQQLVAQQGNYLTHSLTHSPVPN